MHCAANACNQGRLPCTRTECAHHDADTGPGPFAALPIALAGWALLVALPAMGAWLHGFVGVLWALALGVCVCALGMVLLVDDCMADDLTTTPGSGPGQSLEDSRC